MSRTLLSMVLGASMLIATGCYPELPLDGSGGGRPRTEEPRRQDEQTVKVPVGEWVQVGDMSVSLLGVLEDSRCPEGVECVWEGNARISIAVRPQPGGSAGRVELNTHHSRQRTVEVDGYEITLEQLDPHPVDGEEIDPYDYVATLRIVKK